jgi:hypothetical protein
MKRPLNLALVALLLSFAVTGITGIKPATAAPAEQCGATV